MAKRNLSKIRPEPPAKQQENPTVQLIDAEFQIRRNQEIVVNALHLQRIGDLLFDLAENRGQDEYLYPTLTQLPHLS